MAYREIKSENNVEFWKPENEGDVLEGEVVAVWPENTFGLQLDIKNHEGIVVKTPSHRALQAKLANIAKGDKVRIVYEEEVPSKKAGNNPTKIYTVYVDE